MKKILRLQLLLLSLMLLSAAAFGQNKDWLVKMQDPNVNFWEVQKEFNDYWKHRTDYKGNGYKIFKRWEYINESRVLANGRLQAPGYVLKEYQRYMAEAGVKESASGAWTSIGPTGYPSNNTTQPTGMGRVNAIAFHPTDINTLFIGAPSGGIWKSVNGGTNWTNLSANIPYLGVSAILIHPSNPNIIYIGTGDRDSDDAPGVGVYKSTDGGATWAPANSGMGNVTVCMMLMHPSDPNTLIAATYDGIYKSTNGGVSWTLRQAGDFRDIKFKPGDPNTMYATRIISPAQYYRSTDNGTTWGQITTPTTDVGTRMVIGVSPANASIVYLVQIKSADRTFKAFLKSTDSGLTFTEQSNSPNIFGYNCDGSGTASQATYDLCIDVDRSNADIVYIGSINTWKSTDGGVNWSPKTHWVGSTFSPGNPSNNCAVSVHADHHWLEWSPLHSPARLYLGHDGGITYTADGGATWTEITNDLAIGQVYKIGQSTQVANTLIAGLQDNGINATTNASSFTTIGGGDGFESQIDYSNPNFCYLENQEGAMRRSTTGALGSYSSIIPMAVNDDAAFSAPYMLHRTDPNIMFLGRENMWRSTNVKASPATAVTWEAISTFPAGLTIRVVEQSPPNLNIMYISRGTGGSSAVYRSDNCNAAANSVVWNTITKPGGQAPTDIKAHPTDENIVYATAGMQVFKSTDKGQTWTDITGNLPALFINCLAYDKDANEGIYIGNQTGVWYKDATISQWVLFSSGLPPVDVRELEIYYDVNPANKRISAATYGRGVWQSDMIQINVVNPADLTTIPYSPNRIDLSWTLNASNNNVLIATSPTTTFGVPLDGTGYSAGNSLPGGGTVIYVGNLTNFSHTALTAGTSYCYKIWSVNGSNQYSAGLPPVCTATLSHDWTGNVNTDWFNTGNWGPGTVPTATNGAYFPAGRPNYPLISAAGATCYHLTIEAGASVSMHATTSYTLNVTGDWLNDGTFTKGVGTVAFNGTNALQTIRGSSTTAFYIIQVDKGLLNNILEVKSLITTEVSPGFNSLVVTSGTFKLSSASSINVIRLATTLGAQSGIWNNGGTIQIGNTALTLNGGLLRVTAGTVNIGVSSAVSSLIYLNNGTLIMEGGALNIAGRFGPNSGTSSGTYTQTGGTLTLHTAAISFSTSTLFQLNTGVPFTMSAGTIAIRRQTTNVAGEVVIASTTHNVTGGTLQIGDASTPAAQTIRINSTVPLHNLTVNATNAPTAQLLTSNLTVKNDLTISGGTLNANNLNLNVGGHWTNNGTFTPGTGAVTFDGTANQNLGGSTATTFNNLTLNNAAGLTLNGSANTTVNGALTLSSGVISTGNNSLVIPSTGSVARTSGHIFGNLQKHVAVGVGSNRTFEIGDAAAANYTPVAVTFASVSTPGNLTAKSLSGDHPQIGSAALNAAKSVNRYWTLTNGGTAFTTYDAVFNFLTADLDPAVNTSALVCGKYDAPNWTAPTVGTTTANSTQITGVASFSDFQLAEPGGCVDPDVPSLSATGNPVCAGQPTTLSIATGNLNGAANWQWYSGSCGGTPEGTGASIIVSPGSATTYYARGEGGCVVTPGACGNVAITVNPLPTPAITGPSAVCSGGSALLDAGAGYSAYAWSNSGGSNQTATFTNITSNTTYTVTVTDGNGCQGTDTHAVNVNALPTPTITGPSLVCSGDNALLDAGAGYAAYAWSNSGGSNQTATFTNITINTTYTVTVTDGNGCQGTDTHAITVGDITPPSVSCPANQTVPPTINSPCSEIVNGIDGLFSDNCAGSTIAYAFSGATPGSGSGQASGQTFLAGVTTVTYTVTDGVNLTSSCMFTVTVTACALEFSGTILWEHDGTSGVKDATVNLTGAGTGSALTDVNGNYLISIPPTSGNFTIKPVKNINRLNGVTSADVSAVQLHVVGTTLLPGPFKIIAADVTRNGSVSSTDVSVINQSLLGNPSALNIFSVFWRFVPTTYVFPNPNSPLLGFPEKIDLTGVSTNQTGKNFYGIKLGDVVATFANPANFGAGEPLVWRVNDQVLQTGETLEVDFRADQLDDLASFQFALHFDPEQLTLEAIEPLGGLPTLSADHFGLFNLAEGEIRMVWAQTEGRAIEEATPVFRLKFTALDSGRKLSEVLRLENSILPGYSYKSDFAESGVQLKYTETTGTNQAGPGTAVVLFQNQPNPFSKTTTIGFMLPEPADAQLRVYDLSGRLVHETNKRYPAGHSSEEILLEGTPGVLIYELITPFGTATKRMVRIGRQ